LYAGGKYFVSSSVLFLKGKRRYYDVPVLGPARSYSQLEIPASMAREIGVPVFYTMSGKNLNEAPKIKIGTKFSPVVHFEIPVISVLPHIHVKKDIGVKQVRLIVLSPKKMTLVLQVCPGEDIENTCIHLDPDEYAAIGVDDNSFDGVLDYAC
jgi:propanediol utilization protein